MTEQAGIRPPNETQQPTAIQRITALLPLASPDNLRGILRALELDVKQQAGAEANTALESPPTPEHTPAPAPADAAKASA